MRNKIYDIMFEEKQELEKLRVRKIETIIKAFLDESLSNLRKEYGDVLPIDFLQEEYQKWCEKKRIRNCCEKQYINFGKYLRKIIDNGDYNWSYWNDTAHILPFFYKREKKNSRPHRSALVHKPKVSEEEKGILCGKDKENFIEYYTHQYLTNISDTVSFEDAKQEMINYINDRLHLRRKVCAYQRVLGRPWADIKRLKAYQISLLKDALGLV